jgi:RHS repeat-associated protein
MLNEFTLINMNARLYDPVAGMMLSPDNVLQEPTNSQNYHKYAYCFNNPLKYNDPTGNFGEIPGSSYGMNSYNPYAGYNTNIQTNYVNISNTTSSTTFNYQSTSISVNYTNQFNSFNFTSTYSSYNYTTPESVTWGYYESKSYSFNGVNVFGNQSKVELSYPNYASQYKELNQGLNVSPNPNAQGNGGQDPYGNSHGLPVYTAEQFLGANHGKSYFDIITQQPKKDGLPGGPTMRMVINPQDGRIMDMRHVMVVGYGGGNIIGAAVEVGQWLGPYYGKPGARGSAFDKQDFYSNNIGASFFTNSLFTGTLGKDWSSSFYSWINKKK